jgi:hypothetical protein
MSRNAIAGWSAGLAAWLWLLVGATAAPPRDPAASRYFKVRLAAVQALARRADAASRARLQAMTADDHPLVRRAARRSLPPR